MNIAKLSITLSAALISLLWSLIAQAAAIKVSVRANATSGLYTYVQYDPTRCSSMMAPKFKIKYVENGKIVGTKGSFKLTKGPCKGRTIKGVNFRYTPKRGYRGTDKAAIQLNMSAYIDGTGNASRTLNFIIDVK